MTRTILLATMCLASSLTLCGCDLPTSLIGPSPNASADKVNPATQTQPEAGEAVAAAPQPNSEPQATAIAVPADQAAPAAAAVEPAPPAPPAPVPAAAAATGGATEVRVKLSAGVALPQSLPQGTVMSFSVDYQFQQGQPSTLNQYDWVIEPANGKPVAVQVSLESSGTLQAFVETLRPENGPFQSYLAEPTADGGHRPISSKVPMRL